jgi:transcriptional regulator with XRE-family HTH domain
VNQVSNEIGRRIKEAREEQGLTQKDLAVAIGVNPATLCWYETGQTCCSIPALLRIIDYLQIPMSALLPRKISSLAIALEKAKVNLEQSFK